MTDTFNSVLAWHFAGMRSQGLHASERLIDALQYAPGPLLWVRLDLEGAVLETHERFDPDYRDE